MAGEVIAPEADAESADPVLISRRSLGLFVAALTLTFGAAIMTGATEFSVGWSDRGPEPGYFPFWIGLVIVLGSLATLVQTWLQRSDQDVAAITRGQARRALTFLAPMVGFLAIAHWLGIYVATIIYLFVVMVAQGGYGVALSGLVSGGTAISLYLMFDKWLKVPLAKGPLEALLGIH